MTKHKHRFSTFIGHGESPAQTANEIRRMMDRGEPLPVAQIADLVERHGDEIEGLMDELREARARADESEIDAEDLRSEVIGLEDVIASLEEENERLSKKDGTR